MEKEVEVDNLDAFSIIMFQCQDCGAIEQIYNGTNLDVPMFISCEACPGCMAQLPTQRISMPNFEPPVGLRMFVEMTREDAKADLKIRITGMWKDIKHNYKNVNEAVNDFMERFYKEGEVAIVQVEAKVEEEADRADCCFA